MKTIKWALQPFALYAAFTGRNHVVARYRVSPMYSLLAALQDHPFAAVLHRHGFPFRVGWAAQPIIALVAGVLILIRPKFLNFIVAVYLIVIGLIGLFHWL